MRRKPHNESGLTLTAIPADSTVSNAPGDEEDVG